uniref:F-box domain-containing protein n=1 Tax=Percolomonas cosmopolitus TaxID=63605 RepID=A0A7S1KUE1_9EUKA
MKKDSQWRYAQRNRASSVVDFANSLRMSGAAPTPSLPSSNTSLPSSNNPPLRKRSDSTGSLYATTPAAKVRRETSPLVRRPSPIASRTYSSSPSIAHSSSSRASSNVRRNISHSILIPRAGVSTSETSRESPSPTPAQKQTIHIVSKKRHSTPGSDDPRRKLSASDPNPTRRPRRQKISPADLQRQKRLEREYPKMISNSSPATVLYHNRPDSPLLSSAVSVMSGETDVLSSPGTDISASHVSSSASPMPESSLWVNPQRIRNYLYSSSTSSVNDDSSSRIESPQTATSPTPSQSPPRTSPAISRLSKNRKRSNSWAGHSRNNPQSSPLLLNQTVESHQRSMRRNSLSPPQPYNGIHVDKDISPYSVTKWSTNNNTEQLAASHRQRSFSVNMHEPMRLMSDETLSEEFSSLNGEQIEHLSPRGRDSLTPNNDWSDAMSPPRASSAHEDGLSPYSDAAYDVLHESDEEEEEADSTQNGDARSAGTDMNIPECEVYEPPILVDRFEVRWTRTDQVNSYMDMMGYGDDADDDTPDKKMPSTDIFKRTRRANSQRKLFVNNDENNKRRRQRQQRGIHSHVNDLPDDLLARVLSFIGFMQRTPLSVVCKQWYHALKNEQSIIWRTINVDCLPGHLARQYQVLNTILNRYGKFIQILRGSVDISPNLALLAEKCKEVREMHICIGRELNQYEYDFVRHFRILVSQNRHIRKVNISQSRPIIGHESIVEMVSTCKYLRALEISCHFDMRSPLDCENDDESVIVDSPLALDTTRAIANKCFKLHSLKLVDFPVNDESIEHIVKQCFVLKSLDISLMRLTEDGCAVNPSKFFALPHVSVLKLALPRVIHPLPVIQSLNNRTDYTVTYLSVQQQNVVPDTEKRVSTSDLLHEIISLGADLHCLHLRSPHIELSDADMEIIGRRLPNLCQLQVFNASQITPRSLFVLIRFCPHLKVLFLPSLQATEKDIQQFERHAPQCELLCQKIVEKSPPKNQYSRSLLARHQLIDRRNSSPNLLNGKPRWNRY